MKFLILGGYGTFGGRLAQLLADEPAARLIIAGRSREKAAAFCARLGASNAAPASFDRNGAIEAQLAELAPDLIVDASGPFQLYDDPYRVVRAALAQRIDYLDLADSTGFVKGIAQFDAGAKSHGIFLLAGASSFPVLTAAVIRRLAGDIATLEAVAGGIAPSPYAGVGLNVIRAITSYAGKPIASIRDGKPHYALAETRRYVIAPPGRLPLDQVHFSLVDVPDLEVLPALWPSLRHVWMGAGPVPESLHRALNVLAQAVRLRLIPSLTPFAPFIHRVSNLLRWGEHRGGMFVSVDGLDLQGQRTERSWHMIAEGDDGPFIPSMAAEVIIRNCIAGRRPAAGARPATNDVELSDYEAMFARRRIYTGTRIRLPASAPLYRRLLGAAFDGMPAPWRAMHELKSELKAEGVARVDRGTGALARLVATVFGFPAAADHVPVKVTFTARGGIETWRRQFSDRGFVSTQQEGSGRFERLLCERFGPFRFGLALVIDNSRMRLIVRRWSVFGVVLPRAWAPVSTAYEFVEDGRFNFHVEIGHPLTGLIVRYQGWLVPHA
jgi:Domain of unknown function (DUF4166)/Saccharopine dehydrogenase NADP binding domain